jgi:hypothetical protein
MAKKLTAHEMSLKLFATPKAMIAWLEAQKPRAVVCGDALSNTDCLGARFLKSLGFDVVEGNSERDTEVNVVDYFDVGKGKRRGWFANVVNALPVGKRVTAAAALKVVREVTSNA